jgi:hypothetical protein
MGTGAGQIAIDSRGRVSCRTPARCRSTLVPTVLGSLNGAIARIQTARFDGATASSVCSDCYVTRVIVRRRGADGGLTTNVYVWTAIDEVPDDVRQVHAAIRSAAILPDVLRAQWREG